MPHFCMLPDEAESWLEAFTVKCGLAVARDPGLSWRRWVGPPEALAVADLARPGEFGLVMVDVPQLEDETLLLGFLGFKGYKGFAEAAALGRKVTSQLRRDVRRACTIPLNIRDIRSGAEMQASCWASEAAIASPVVRSIQQLGCPLQEFLARS